jgi:hypothetical protein
MFFSLSFLNNEMNTLDECMNMTAPMVMMIAIKNLLFGNLSSLLLLTLEKKIPMITTIIYRVFLAMTCMGYGIYMRE